MGDDLRDREPDQRRLLTGTRRSAYAVLRYADGEAVDFLALLRGELRRDTELVAASALTGREVVVDAADLDVLVRPDADDAPPAVVERLARAGLLVVDAADPELAGLRSREERLAAAHWSPRAAVFHFLSRREGVDVGIDPVAIEGAPDAEEASAALVADLGPPPPAFHSVGGPAVELPLAEADGELFTTLRRRRTTRSFARDRELPLAAFSTVLRYTFGAHGVERLGELVSVSKTSPSGGGLHPIEAYPLVVRVEGIDPGLYHYDVESHALHAVTRLGGEEAERLVREFTAGQFWFADAHALVVLAARFGRSFWKYRRDDRAYAVLLLDAGHLSQTFYLVATGLDLGAFVTAYVNDLSIEQALRLDGIEEGVIAVLGCGVPGSGSPLDPEIVPFVPRETTD